MPKGTAQTTARRELDAAKAESPALPTASSKRKLTIRQRNISTNLDSAPGYPSRATVRASPHFTARGDSFHSDLPLRYQDA